jgi:hypothetical protein
MKRTIAPTIVVLVLGVALHLLLALRPFEQLARGGSFMILVAVAALLCVLVQNWLSRRPGLAPVWLALPPAIVVLLGTLGVAGQVRQARLAMIEEQFKVSERAEVFAIAVNDATANAIQACTLAALALAHAAWLLSARNRSEPSSKSAQWLVTVIGGLLATIGLYAWRYHADLPAASAGGLTPAMVLLSIPGLAIAAQRLSVTAGIHSDRKAWGTLLTSAALGVGGVALTTIGGWLGAMQVVYSLSVLNLPEYSATNSVLWAHHASDEIAMGLLAAVCIVAMATIVALSRTAWASLRAVRSPAVALCLVGVPSAVPMLQAVQLMHEYPQYREGRPGELVPDASLPPGTLVVDCKPLVPGVDTGLDSEVKLSNGSSAKWKTSEMARFDDLAPGQPLTFKVGYPYLIRDSTPVVLPADRGARVVLAVLRFAPLFRSSGDQDFVQPEKVLHLDLTSPDKYLLFWTSGRTVHSTREVPRSPRALAESVTLEWQQQGSHKNDADRRQDNAIVHYVEPVDFDDLARHVSVIAALRRTFKGQDYPTFSVYVAATPSESPPDLDEELASIPFDTLPPDETAERANEALERCKGTPCGRTNDLWDVRFRDRCGQLLCSTGAQAQLWLHLGRALALQGDGAGATKAFGLARLLNPSLTVDDSTPSVQKAFLATASLPAGTVRVGAVTVNGRLTPETIRGVVEGRVGFMRACYADALKTNPNLMGRVSVRFVIGRDGTTTNFGNGGSDLPDPKMVSCCVRSLVGMRFPQPEGGIVTVVHPFMFTP